MAEGHSWRRRSRATNEDMMTEMNGRRFWLVLFDLAIENCYGDGFGVPDFEILKAAGGGSGQGKC